MKLTVINTGSIGNCYLLESEHQILILECGVPFLEIKKALGFTFDKVVGCLVTHLHGDHSKSINEVLNAGIKVFSSKETFNALGVEDVLTNDLIRFGSYKIGEFTVKVFDTVHDCPEPFGFIIEHEEMGRMLFCTDSSKIKYTFGEINHYLVEANYSVEILLSGRMDYLSDRVFKTHMSIENLIEYLRPVDLDRVDNLILIHLSDRNSHEKKFIELTEKELSITPKIASKGSIYYLGVGGMEF